MNDGDIVGKKNHLRILNIRNGTTFALLALVTTTWYFAAGLLSPSWRDDSLGGNDWDLNFFYTESSALPVRDFAQIPFWNPFYKGGMPLFENPQARTFTPAVFLALAMGPVRALKFSVFIYFLLGAAGSFYLFRFALSIRSLALVIPVVMVPFCGYVPQHVFAGHANFVSILMFPWCLGAMILFQNTGRFRHVAVFSLSAATILNGETVFKRVIDTVFNPLYELVVGLAIVYFMYGVAKFIYDINDPEKKTTGKQHLLWGSIGLFIILSVGGILPLINGILGGMFQF